MAKSSRIAKIIGVIGIMSVACAAIAWIGLMVSPPWASKPENSQED